LLIGIIYLTLVTTDLEKTIPKNLKPSVRFFSDTACGAALGVLRGSKTVLSHHPSKSSLRKADSSRI
jgi:hypothetical protein